MIGVKTVQIDSTEYYQIEMRDKTEEDALGTHFYQLMPALGHFPPMIALVRIRDGSAYAYWEECESCLIPMRKLGIPL